MFFVEFNCPYCGINIRVKAEELSPEKKILCFYGCKRLVPAGLLYDTPADGEQTDSLVETQDKVS